MRFDEKVMSLSVIGGRISSYRRDLYSEESLFKIYVAM